ncbi:hypothetical protein, partial [Methanoregula sp.]|uniref:hypothetical protein n=1 Tax=Methanoregula sp. TaxID=2052170 RepID=UPI000CB2B094
LIKIITPGWGTSGYYSESMLERDAPAVYQAGTQMFLDHPTAADEKARPERSLTTLAGFITEGGKFLKTGPQGPGVYAKAQILSPYRGFLNEVAQIIGVSHRALGKGTPGSAEGRQGKIIESLTKCFSVDFVTLPGRGGAIVPMLEAYRKNSESLIEHEPPADDELNEDTNEEIMAGNDKETVITVESLRKTHPALITEIRESIMQEIQTSESAKQKEAEHKQVLKENQDMKIELDRLREAQVIQEAGKIVAKALEKSALPAITKARLIETVPKLARMKDGKFDEAAFTEAVTTAIKTETDYVAKLTESGKVKGMGGSGGSGTPSDGTKLKEAFKQQYLREGLTVEQAELKATIAAAGGR